MFAFPEVRREEYITNKDLSIIIVNWNTKQMLQNCVNSILETNDGLNVEIIVVDNASTDGSSTMISKSFPQVRLIDSGGNIGFARANNMAIPHAKAPQVLFLNPDTIVKNGALKKMHDVLIEDPLVGATGCKLIDAAGKTVELPWQIEVTPFKKLFLQIFFSEASINFVKKFLPYHDPYKNGYVRNLFGACLMVRRSVLDQVGCFDEQFFMYAEDIDLCQRIFSHGWKLYYISEAVIVHLEGGASQKTPNDFSTRMMCESISKLMLKYHGKTGQLIYRIGILVSSLMRLIILIVLSTAIKFRIRQKKTHYVYRIRKHMTILKWTFNIPAEKCSSSNSTPTYK